MWALSVVHLGLPIDAFWHLTPRFFFALLDALEVRDLKESWGEARICSILANVHRNKEVKKEPWTIDEFLPPHLQGRFQRDKAPIKEEPTPDQLANTLAIVEQMNVALGGIDLRGHKEAQ